MKKTLTFVLTLCLFLQIALLCCGCTPEMVEVTFQPNNGDAVATVKVEKGLAIDTNLDGIPVPQKRACEFVGWYLNAGEETEKAWDFVTDTVSEPITLTAKWKLTENFLETDPNAGTKSEGTDLRVMSYNTLLPDVGAMIPIQPGRDTGLHTTIMTYLPDVVGLQEFNNDWYWDFVEVFRGDDYAVTGPSYDGKFLSNPIAYRTSTLNMLEYGRYDYMIERCFSWALFETKDENKTQFIVTSTHWSLTDDLRVQQAKELAKQIKKLQEKYNVPVIAVGDYNSYESLESFQTLMSQIQLVDTKYAAAKRGLVGLTTHSGVKITGYKDDKVNAVETIDHIFYTGGFETLYYDTIVDETALTTSDHNPIYADLKFAE